jgi:hypothetical protein
MTDLSWALGFLLILYKDGRRCVTVPPALPLLPLSRGVLVTPVSLPQEPRHLVLGRVDDWQAQAQLPVRVVLDACSNPLLAALGQPRTISCTPYEQSLLHLFLLYKPQGTGHRFPHPVLSSSYQR